MSLFINNLKSLKLDGYVINFLSVAHFRKGLYGLLISLPFLSIAV